MVLSRVGQRHKIFGQDEETETAPRQKKSEQKSASKAGRHSDEAPFGVNKPR